MTPRERLTRMRASFEKKRAILSEDYDFFATPRESIPPSRAAHRSAPQSSRRVPRRSEKP